MSKSDLIENLSTAIALLEQYLKTGNKTDLGICDSLLRVILLNIQNT